MRDMGTWFDAWGVVHDHVDGVTKLGFCERGERMDDLSTIEEITASGGLTVSTSSPHSVSAPNISNLGVVAPEDFGWEPGADLGPYIRDAYEECKSSNARKEIRLTRDPSDADGYYSIYSPSPLTGNRCVYLDGSSYNGIKLVGLGSRITRIKYDHTLGLTSRSILAATGCDLVIEGIAFDGAEAERIPLGSGSMTLNGSIGDSDTSIAVNNGGTYLASSGLVKIDNEWIAYAGRSGDTITGCIRGVRGTIAASHMSATAVIQLASTGHHPVGIGNFRSLRMRDVAILNSPSYGLGIENSGAEYIENLDIEGLLVENTASDGVDVKCPVTNGNKYARLNNIVVKGWSRENGWLTNADQGLDLRIPGAMVSNVDFIFTDYQGTSNAIGIRANQASDYSGGQFSTWSNVQFHGVALTGTVKPTHTGISDSGGAILTNITARNLSGYAGSLRGSRVANFRVDSCRGGFVLNATGSRLHDGAITNCLGEGVYTQNGSSDNIVDNVEASNNWYGFRTTGTGAMVLRNPKASGNSPDVGVTNRDYLLTANCVVEKTRGAFRTVSSNYTVTEDDDVIYVDTSSGNITITLPNASQRVPGREFVLLKISAANSLIIDPMGAITINGAASLTVTEQYAEVLARSNGANYIASK